MVNIYYSLSIIILTLGFLTLIFLFMNSQLRKLTLYITNFNLDKLKFKPISKKYLYYKRVFDIFISIIFLIILLPLNLIIICCIKIFDGGNIFIKVFRTDCITNKEYCLYKFKTFKPRKILLSDYIPTTNLNTLNSISKDPRITKFGSFLRTYYLDSLPKFYNILKGDISLIGRNFYRFRDYPENILNEKKMEILTTIPIGLISLWSISYSKICNKEMSYKNIINYDLMYASKASLVFDLYIYLKTILIGIGIETSK